MSILSEIRQAAQVKSNARRRKFTDQALIQCCNDGLTAAAASRRLGVVHSTLQLHAERLGLVMAKKVSRAEFTYEEDELIRQCSRGEVRLSYVEYVTRHQISSIRLRAAALGVVIKIKRQVRLKSAKVYAVREYDLGDGITVGKVDRYLKRLRLVHHYPRDEVYPGTRKAA